jgi:hypothetical protein
MTRLRCSGHIRDDKRLGYVAWHDKAAESHHRGQRQRQCSECNRFYFSWEKR